MTERWKRSFVDGYDISDMGRIRRNRAGRCTWKGRILKPILMKIGYYTVRPVVSGENLPVYVHAMVAYAFLGPRPKGAEINHIDGDKTNNRFDNLEYTTHHENMQHAARIRLMVRGEKHPGSKLTEAIVRKLRQDREAGLSYSALARCHGVSIATAYNIVQRKLWSHVT